MSGFIDGVTLRRCFEVVMRCGGEVDALIQVLDDMLLEGLRHPGEQLNCVINGDALHFESYDDAGWVCLEVARSFPLKLRGKGRKRTEKYLSYQISLAGDGVPADEAGAQPVLHMCLWESALDFAEGHYVAFPVVREDGDNFEVVDERLLTWGTAAPERMWEEGGWTFSVRLTALNSRDDIERLVIRPTLDLLKGATARDALPERLNGLVRYTDAVICPGSAE